jgi:hypothetical protein
VTRRHLTAAVLYVIATLAALYPESLHPRDTVSFVGDPLDSVYFLAWYAHQLVHDPLHLFDANLLYPHAHAALFDTPRILPSLLAAPVLWTTDNPVLAYNLALMLVYLFAAMSARHLARALGLDAIGSWGAGALYAFHTYQINEIPNINTVFHGFIPLALGELILYLRTGEPRRAWRLGGLMLLQGLADNYTVVYATLLLALVAAVAAVARPSLLARRLGGLVLPAMVTGALFSPIVLAYLGASRVYGYARGLPPSLDLARYLTTRPTNLLYGAIGGSSWTEWHHPHFVGFVALSLALAALVAWAVSDKRGDEAAGQDPLLPARFWIPAAAALGVLFVAFSLGTDIVLLGRRVAPGPYRLLHDFVPGFQYLRFPERLSLIAMLFVALLAGRALTLLGRRGLTAPALLLAALLPIEHLSPPQTTVRVPVGSDVPEVYRWLALNPVHAVAEVPIHGFGLIRFETLDEYFSTYHFRPIIHGLVTFEPPLTRLLRQMADEFPSESSLDAFQRVGVDTVVVHWGRVGAQGLLRSKLEAAEAGGRLVRRARLEGPGAHVYEGSLDEVYGLVPVPAAPAASFPRGHRVRDPDWRYAANDGNPELAGDGDLSTAWSVPGELQGDEFLQIAFRGRALSVSGLVLPEVGCLGTVPTFLPTRFRVKGRLPDGRWVELARLDHAHLLQRVDHLLANPGRGAVGFDLKGERLTAIRLLLEEGSKSFEGWSLPEVEIWTP